MHRVGILYLLDGASNFPKTLDFVPAVINENRADSKNIATEYLLLGLRSKNGSMLLWMTSSNGKYQSLSLRKL